MTTYCKHPETAEADKDNPHWATCPACGRFVRLIDGHLEPHTRPARAKKLTARAFKVTS